MVLLGFLSVLLACLLHCWYAGNAGAWRSERAIGYIMHGPKVLLVAILFLLTGLLLIWIGTGFALAALVAFIYFFLLSPLTMLLLQSLKFVPPADPTRRARERLDHEIEPIIADSPQEQLLRMKPVWAMGNSYFRSKQTEADKPDSYHLFSALKACCPDSPETVLRGLAEGCPCLEDAIVEAVRLQSGNNIAERLRSAINTRPICTSCGERRALHASACDGCLFYRTKRSKS